MFFLIIFNLVMYMMSKVLLAMIYEFMENKDMQLLEIMFMAVFTGVCFVKNSLNFTSIIYLLIYVYVIYETLIIVCYSKSFFRFLKNES